MNTHDVIIRPIVTEKSLNKLGGDKISFVVAKDASKTDIKLAVKQAFNANVQTVTTITIKGGSKRVGNKRQEIKNAAWKKAIVVLKKGESLKLKDMSSDKDKKEKKKK